MRIVILFSSIFILFSCDNSGTKMESHNKIIAENFFKGIYGCNSSVVDKYASDSIVVSYPIFKKVYKKISFRGKKEVKSFAQLFCSRWKNAQITIHESIEEGKSVVILWSFKGTFAGESIENGPQKNSESSWGGITLFHFDNENKILVEIGEESSPGPFKRLN